MAENESSIGQLVTDWTLNIKDWVEKATQVKSTMSSVAAANQQAQSQNQAANAQAVAGIKAQQTAHQATIQTQVQGAQQVASATKTANTQTLADLQKLNEAQAKQLELIKEQVKAMKEKKEVGGKGGVEQEETEVIEKRLQRSNIAKIGRTLGGSTLTNLGVAAVAGGSIGLASASIETIVEGFEKLVDAIKETIKESGQLQQLEATFKGLAGSGADAFFDKLRESTHNLVMDTNLYKEANTLLGSSLKISKAQVVELTEATVGLARAHAHTATQAVDTLTRALTTNRFTLLGEITGINGFQQAVGHVGGVISNTQRQQEEFNRAFEIITKRFENITHPMDTYADRLTQLAVVQDRLHSGFAEGFLDSKGFGSFMVELGKVIDRMGGLEGLAKKIGQTFGDAFAGIGPLFLSIQQAVIPIEKAFASLFGTISNLSSSGSKGSSLKNTFEAMHPVVDGMITAFAYLGQIIRETAADLQYLTGVAESLTDRRGHKNVKELIVGGARDIWQGLPTLTTHFNIVPGGTTTRQGVGELASGMLSGGLVGNGRGTSVSVLTDRYQSQLRSISKDTQNIIKEAQSAYGKAEATGGANNQPNTQNDPDFERRQALSAAKDEMQQRIAAAQEYLAQMKEIIGEQRDDTQQMYKDGTISAQTYYQKTLALAQADRDAAISSAQQVQAARTQELAKEVQLGAVSGGRSGINSRVNSISDQEAKAEASARTTYSKALAAAADVYNEYLYQGFVKALTDITETQKIASAEQTEALKSQFEDGLVAGADYIEQRKQQINDLADFEVRQFQLQAAAKPADVNLRNQMQDQITKSGQQRNLQLSQLSDTGTQTQYSQVQKNYQSTSGLLQAQNGPGLLTSDQQNQNMQQQVSLTQTYISLLQQLSGPLDQQSNTWKEIQTAILSAQQSMVQMVVQMQQMNSLTTATSDFFGQISQSGQSIFKGSFGAPFIQSLGQGASSAKFFQGFNQIGNTNAGYGGTGEDSITGAFGQSIKDIIDGGASGGGFKELGSTLTQATQAVGSFASVIANATSPLGGLAGGAQSGAGLGSALGAGLGPLGSLLGGLAGAAGGGLLGFISGGKMQQVHQDIVDMQQAALQMNEAFSSGNASLGQTINTLQTMIATLTQEMDSSKKGGSQYQQLITQYNQQLQQLQSQATQTMQSLSEQLASISQPASYQQWVSQISQVVQQYSQFVGAAQNANQLADANQYLTSSLQNMGQQISDTLLQDEETAIQEALQLNQLYNQRNQLQLQYLQEVQQIMSQGNVTRQRTQAQSAFSQLYNAQVSYSQQLDQINQQISLTQAQVTAAQQVFNLATTRVGLENQLLTLQEQGIAEDMQRISALQNVLGVLQSTGYSIAGLSGVSGSDPNALINTLLSTLTSDLNTGNQTMANQLQQIINLLSASGGLGATTGPQTPNTAAAAAANGNAVTAQFSALYKSRASFGYARFRGATL